MRWIPTILLFLACGSSKDHQTLHEAATAHDQALEIAHQTALRISQFKQLETSFTPAQRDTLMAIARDLGAWYELVVEVPGHDHDHHEHEGHDHDHDHDHASEPNYLEGLPAEEVLEVQASLKRQVERLSSRLLAFSQTILLKKEENSQ